MHFGDDLRRDLDMLKHRFRNDGIESRVFEGEAMPVADDIDIRRGFDFEVNRVRRASIKAGAEIEDFGVLTELAQDAFDGFVPARRRVGASHENGEKTGLAETIFYLGDSVGWEGRVLHEGGWLCFTHWD